MYNGIRPIIDGFDLEDDNSGGNFVVKRKACKSNVYKIQICKVIKGLYHGEQELP